MKNWKNILLTALAVLMLLGFAAATPSPAISDEAYERYMGLTE